MTPFVVAGAGIGGLSAAIALARHGIGVTILERREMLDEAGAGIQLSPNATRHLADWGLLEQLTAASTLPEAIRIRSGMHGTELARLPLAQKLGSRGRPPFLLLHRAELQAILAKAVLAAPGVELRLGNAVRDLTEESDAVTVAITNSRSEQRLRSRGFVAATGYRVPGFGDRSDTSPPLYSGRMAWRALVSASDLPPEFSRPESNLWLGPKTHLVHYPLRGATIVNVVAIVDDPEGRRTDAADLWSRPGERSILLRHFGRWHTTAKALIEAAPNWQVWPLFDGRAGRAWSQGRRTVLGDAAHPMLPFLAQGASQSIEDAAALADAVAQEPADAVAAFCRYESLRRGRAERVQEASRRQGRIYHLGGVAALARDTVMRLLGPEAMLARMAWLYDAGPAPPRRRDAT